MMIIELLYVSRQSFGTDTSDSPCTRRFLFMGYRKFVRRYRIGSPRTRYRCIDKLPTRYFGLVFLFPFSSSLFIHRTKKENMNLWRYIIQRFETYPFSFSEISFSPKLDIHLIVERSRELLGEENRQPWPGVWRRAAPRIALVSDVCTFFLPPQRYPWNGVNVNRETVKEKL